MNEQQLVELKNTIGDLGFDYQRMSLSGKSIYDKLVDQIYSIQI